MGDSEITESHIQRALDETGFGKFNIKVTIICCLMFLNAAFCTTAIGFLLPSAACDFQMNTLDKDRLSSAFMFGLLAGSYLWGCFADFKGRKVAIMVAVFTHGAVEFVSSFVLHYWSFVILKFFSGLLLSGQSSLVFTYLGECQPTKQRERMLSLLEMAWSVGLIILPLYAWGIIPSDFKLEYLFISLKSWNVFVLGLSFPSLMIGLWMTTFPESPKYLAETNQIEKLRLVLGRIYNENTGNPAEEFFEIMTKHNIPTITETIRADVDQNSNLSVSNKKHNDKFKMFYSQTISLFRRPYLGRTLCSCTVMFCITSSYYTLILWFPELFQRFTEYETKYPNETLSICTVANGHLGNDTLEEEDLYGCNTKINSNVFTHILVLGVSCIPAGIILSATINRLGYKFFLVTCTALGAMITIGMLFVQSSAQNLILSCLFESTLSLCFSVIFCVVVDLFPTKLRAMAASLTAFFGRLGGLFGNALFGYLIESACVLLIGLVALQLIISSVISLCITMPKDKEKKKKLKNCHAEECKTTTQETA